MAVDSADPPAGLAAASIVRAALKGALGTLDRRSGGPYTSLVTVATEPDGSPILLISRLALHTRNLDADPRASLMLEGRLDTFAPLASSRPASDDPLAKDAPLASDDPLASGRVTLSGRCRSTDSATAARRFLSRHPSAAVYAGFADFRFFAFEIDRIHLVGGFGRIVDLTADAVLSPMPGALRLADREPDILAELNDDQSGVPAALGAVLDRSISPAPPATMRGGGPSSATRRWRVSGIDPFGCDATNGAHGERIWFTRAMEDTQSASSPSASASARAGAHARAALLDWASARAGSPA